MALVPPMSFALFALPTTTTPAGRGGSAPESRGRRPPAAPAAAVAARKSRRETGGEAKGMLLGCAASLAPGPSPGEKAGAPPVGQDRRCAREKWVAPFAPELPRAGCRSASQ